MMAQGNCMKPLKKKYTRSGSYAIKGSFTNPCKHDNQQMKKYKYRTFRNGKEQVVPMY